MKCFSTDKSTDKTYLTFLALVLWGFGCLFFPGAAPTADTLPNHKAPQVILLSTTVTDTQKGLNEFVWTVRGANVLKTQLHVRQLSYDRDVPVVWQNWRLTRTVPADRSGFNAALYIKGAELTGQGPYKDTIIVESSDRLCELVIKLDTDQGAYLFTHIVPGNHDGNITTWPETRSRMIAGRIERLIMLRAYSRLEDFFDVMSKNYDNMDEEGNNMMPCILEDLAEHYSRNENSRKMLERWCAHSPENPYPYLLRGAFYMQSARETGWSGPVTGASANRFQTQLQRARNDLEKSFNLNPSCPLPPLLLITVGSALVLGDDYVNQQFLAAIELAPDSIHPYRDYLFFSLPEWGGSYKKMLLFSWNYMKPAAPDSPVVNIMSITHGLILESLGSESEKKRYLQQLHVWRHISEGYDRFLKVFPGAVLSRNRLIQLAIMAEKWDTAREQLTIIGQNGSMAVWGDDLNFTKAVKQVKAHAPF